jgi:diguanylate cyclase (GGDEF)-like protein/PAS domain S-box-containing protein
VPGTHFDSEQRLSLILETQQAIAAAGDDIAAVMQIVAERSTAIIGADGAMVNLVEGDILHTRAASGTAAQVHDARRPIAQSIARYAIESGEPLLVEDTRTDHRINQELRGKVGDTSLICVPLFSGLEVVGTLNVMSCSETERLSEEDRQTLEMLSVVLSAGVSRVAEFDARRAQAQAVARFRALFDGASLGILRLDADGVAVEVNPALEEMLGASAEDLIGSRFSAHLIAEHRETVDELLAETVAGTRGSFALEARCTTRSGGSLWAHVRAVAELREGDAPLRVVAMIENITERKRAEQELIHQSQLNEHQALHDPLTGLPNRLLFGERIGHAIRHAERTHSKLAVVLMDLDRFKEVNDSLGHSAGDELLVKVGARMRDAIRGSDTVARLGGDEFGLLLPDLHDGEGAVPVITRIRAALERPVHVHSLPLAVEASIGIAIYPDHGTDAQALIQKADVAMYDSKRDNASHTFYDEGSHEYDLTRLTLVAELRRAIAAHELILHYQPKAALESGDVRSVEALLRWVHPERGMVFPDSFIPIAQETGLIGPLTLYVVEEALRQGRRWRDAGLNLSISVNLSTRNLLDRDFPNQVAALLKRWGMGPEWLELEVTESSMLANPTRAKAVLNELSALGVRLSIDDFGTGYSSLSYLRQLPVDEIKIDRSFVMGMGEQAGDAVIVRSTVDLGRNLGLEVVAEGVETLDSWNTLRALGCNTAQGYFLSKPVSADELTSWLKARPEAEPEAEAEAEAA